MIPKTLHLCFGLAPDFGGKPWSLVHYACIRSAIEHIKPQQTFLYYEFEPQGPWWDITKALVKVLRIEAPREIYGNPLLHPAQRAGVVRLQKLLDSGGIYLDCDVLVHRSFDDLLTHSTVLGQEGKDGKLGLCDAVILAEPNAPFLKRWLDQYRTFRSKGLDVYWGEHAVEVPHRLSEQFPGEVTVLPHTAFFWPTWQEEDLSLIFRSNQLPIGPDVYAHHLWETTAWDAFLADLTPGRVRKLDGAFHQWVRPFVSHLPADFGQPPLAKRLANELRRIARHLRSTARTTIRTLEGAGQ